MQLPPLYDQRRIADILDRAADLRRKRRETIRLTDELIRSAFATLVGERNDAFESWPRRRIDDLALPTDGAVRTGPFGSALRHTEFVGSGVAVLGIDNAVRNRFAWGQRRFITTEKYSGLARYRVHPGDVLITIMGTIGRTAVVPDDIPVAITTKHLATITVNRELVQPEFLAHVIHSDPSVLRQIRDRNRGAIMDGLNLGLIRTLELRVPPLEQQARFASTVEAIRAHVARVEAHGDQLDMAFDGLVSRAFTGTLTFNVASGGP